MTALYFRDARLIDPASGMDENGCLIVQDGVISAAGSAGAVGKPPKDATIIDARGAVLAPGLIDMRVQSRNPGHAYKESRASLARAAAAGGITSMVCLPNTCLLYTSDAADE